MNWSLKDIESFTPVDFARFLFDNTAANGVLHMPKRFGSIKERDDDFDEFIMCWKNNDLDFLISKFNTLYDNLSKIANVYDKLSENETSVKNVLIDPELFDTWRVYVRRLEIGDFDRKTLDPVLEKELYKSELTKEESDSVSYTHLYRKKWSFPNVFLSADGKVTVGSRNSTIILLTSGFFLRKHQLPQAHPRNLRSHRRDLIGT